MGQEGPRGQVGDGRTASMGTVVGGRRECTLVDQVINDRNIRGMIGSKKSGVDQYMWS